MPILKPLRLHHRRQRVLAAPRQLPLNGEQLPVRQPVQVRRFACRAPPSDARLRYGYMFSTAKQALSRATIRSASSSLPVLRHLRKAWTSPTPRWFRRKNFVLYPPRCVERSHPPMLTHRPGQCAKSPPNARFLFLIILIFNVIRISCGWFRHSRPEE